MIEWVPTASALVLNVAFPEPLRVPLPSVVEPSLNVTLPVGVGPDPALTVAVKVTELPWVDGLLEEVRVVVVNAASTTCASTLEVLVR